MKIGGKTYRIFAILALAIGSFIVSPLALATDSQVQVIVGDVCPNIPGNQPTLPSGMKHDGDGNCYTPAPPPPPDTCPNLPGDQTVIPSGYYRNQSGVCVAQTKPPKDVCPNIADIQSEVPYGMQTAANNNCVWPPADICPNIPGPQEIMPKDMSYDAAGNCQQTPTPITTPTYPSKKPTSPTDTNPLSPLPYLLLGPLWFVLLLLLLQTLRESFATKGIIIIFRQKKHEAETLAEVIERLISHLEETATNLVNSASALTPSDIIDGEMIKNLMSAAQKLRANLASSAAEPPAAAFDSHDAFSRDSIHVKTLRSPLFWAPVLLTVIAVIGANIMLGTLSPATLSSQYLWLQPLALIVVSASLFIVLRSRHIRHIQHNHVEQLVKDTVGTLTAQETFLHRLCLVLDEGVRTLHDQRKHIQDATFAAAYDEIEDIARKLGTLFDKATPHDTLDAESLKRLLDERQDQTAQSHTHPAH